MKNLKYEIKHIMEETLEENITDDFNKFKSENWDSFMHLDLVVKLEEKFEISFSPEEIGSMDSFNDIVGIVEHKLGKKS